MSVRMSGGLVLGAILMIIVAAAAPAGAEEQSVGEAAGAGQMLQEVETPPAVICGGCVSPTFAGEGSIVPYGRIEGCAPRMRRSWPSALRKTSCAKWTRRRWSDIGRPGITTRASIRRRTSSL